MREKIGFFLLCLIGLALSGCTSAGNEVLKKQDASTVNQTVIDGTTTRDQILSMYGSPNRTTFGSNNSEIWTYTWASRRPQAQNFIPIVGTLVAGADVQQKVLIVQFDERHVVKKHVVSEYNNTVKRDYSSAPPSSSSSPKAASPN